MTVDRRTAAQFADDLRQAIQARAAGWDVGVEAVPDTMVLPQAVVLEAQNERLRKVSLVQVASNEAEFDDIAFEPDLDALVSNEGMLRNAGSRSVATATFRRAAAPTADATVPRGYPVGTLLDDATGASVVFVASETRTMLAAQSASYYNPVTKRYELSVPMVAIIAGASGRVGVGRISRLLRPLANFDDGVTNAAASVGGRDRETNRELIGRYRLAVVGQQLSTPLGLVRDVKTNDPDVRDLLPVYGSSPLLVRGDAGAVDAWVLGDQILETTDQIAFSGFGQTMVILSPPLRAVVAVTQGPTTYVEGTDYDVVFDATGYGGSTRAAEGIRWRVGGPNPLPAVGSAVGVDYTYNDLIRSLQAEAADSSRDVFGRGLLYRQSVAVPIVVGATLRVGTGLNRVTVLAAVRTALLALVNVQRGLAARPLNDPTNPGGLLEVFALDGAVEGIAGAIDLVVTVFRRSSQPAGPVVDLPFAQNENPTLADADLTITLV